MLNPLHVILLNPHKQSVIPPSPTEELGNTPLGDMNLPLLLQPGGGKAQIPTQTGRWGTPPFPVGSRRLDSWCGHHVTVSRRERSRTKMLFTEHILCARHCARHCVRASDVRLLHKMTASSLGRRACCIRA